MPTIDPNIYKKIQQTAGKVAGVSTMIGGLSNNKLATKLGAAAGLVSAGAGLVSRLSSAGLLPGGAVVVGEGGLASNGVSQTADDWRVKIGVGVNSGIFYRSGNPGILGPLAETNGVVFPYTPSITLSYQNNYQPMGVTHSINTQQAYQNSDVSSITISGDFTAQTPEEANYVLAVIHFFKSASKMYFGDADIKTNIGAPPPVLFLSGFGEHYFPNVSVLLQSFTHTMSDDVDFIYGNPLQRTRVPTRSNIQLTLVPQYSRTKTASFNLDKFARGELITGTGNFL
jgi:hypothetical protein